MNRTQNAKENIIFKIILLNIVLAFIALVKDVFLAKLLGTSALSDALFIAYFIPDTIGNNLIAISLGVSIIPVFSSLNKNKDKSVESGNTVGIILVFSTLLLFFILILALFKEKILEIIAYGFDASTISLAEKYFVILLPIILLYPLFTIGSSLSNVKKSFLIPAFAPILFNFFILIGILLNYNKNEISNKSLLIISVFILAGVALMVILVWGNVTTKQWIDFKIENIKKFDIKYLKQLLVIFVPFILMILFSQSVLFFERYFASTIAEGTVSGLNYAFRISQLPIWIFVAGISTYSLPEISELNENKKLSSLSKIVNKYLKLVFILIIPMMLIINILRNQIIEILFVGKNFNTDSLTITSNILMGYSFVIFGSSIFMIVTRFLVPMKRIKWPLVFTILSTIIIIVSNKYLIPILDERAIGISTAIGSTVNGIFLLIYINSTLKLQLRSKFMNLMKLVLSNIPVVCLSYLLIVFWDLLIVENNIIYKLLFGLISVILLTTVYLVMLKITKIYNIITLLNKFKRYKEV